MTVTQPQAQMLTTLALACRPHGAPRWDAPGVMAAIKRVAHLRLADVTRAVTRAAEDTLLDTPAPIGIPTSPCWADHTLDDRPTREPWNSGTFCDVTGQPMERCRRNWDDHEHVTAAEAEARRTTRPLDVRRTVDALKTMTALDPRPVPEEEL
jgi:hypothetical protein